MKGIRIFLVLGAAIALSAGDSAAQTGADAIRFSQRLPLASPQSVGSAGSGIAGRGEIGDLFRNPAGLGLMPRGALSVGLNTSNVQDDAIYRVGTGGGVASKSEITATRLGNVSYAYKLPTSQGSMVIAAGLSQVASFQRSLAFSGENGLNSLTDYLMPLPEEFDLFEEDGALVPEFYRNLSFIGYETFAIDLDAAAADAGEVNPFLPAVSFGTVAQSGFVTEEGQMSEFAVGGAVEAAKDVMVGVSLNVPFGRYRYDRVLDEEDIFNDNDGTGGTTDFDYLSFAEGFESRLVGINLRAGVTARLADNMRLGLSLETPTYYTISEDFDTVLFTSFDNGDAFEYGDNADEDAGRGSFDYNLRTPWKLGAGLSYDAGRLSVHGDLELVDWSQMEFSADGYSFADENLAIRQQLEATVNVRVGAAYRFDRFEIRTGLAVEPDARIASDSGLDRDRGILSLGLSYKVNPQFAFDLGLMTEVFEDAYSPYSEVADAPQVSEDLARNFLSLGVRVGL